MTFAALGLAEPLLRSIAAEGYHTPTPIQTQAIPHVLAGRDVLGCAQTGTGKTAAFALPLAHRLMSAHRHAHHAPAHAPTKARPIRALILSPTRELALQIADNLSIYARHTGLRHVVIFGGVTQNPQTRALHAGVDIVVATPGRLLDLMQQGHVDLRHVETFILDEADRMLDMGFIDPIRRIAAAVPAKRQTLLFSATMPAPIRHLADALLRDPVSVQLAPPSSLPERIEQGVYHVRRIHKPHLLAHVLSHELVGRTLVFTRTKHGADRLVRHLHSAGIHAEAIHGNKRQNIRQRTLANFRAGKTTVLVATDIAARGIDVDDITHVVNFDIPHEPETYVHRIGRTGRAGNAGIAVSFCDEGERSDFKAVERLLKRSIEVRTDQPHYPPTPAHEFHAPRGPHSSRPSHPRRESDHPRARSGQGRPHQGRPNRSPGSGGHGVRQTAQAQSTGVTRDGHPRHAAGSVATSKPSSHAPSHPKRAHNPLAKYRQGGRSAGPGRARH